LPSVSCSAPGDGSNSNQQYKDGLGV
jgi:hypothetical protein